MRAAGAIVRRGRPGERMGVRLFEPNGAECAWLSDGDAWVVYYREMDRRVVVRHPLTSANALRLAWFILWRWWALRLWFGIRLRLWHWALLVQRESPADDARNTGT